MECQKICQIICQKICQIEFSDGMPEDMPEHLPEDMPEHLPEDMPGRMPEDMPDRMPDRMPENMSDRMPEDLPVTKCINVMVGITRSKVIFYSANRKKLPLTTLSFFGRQMRKLPYQSSLAFNSSKVGRGIQWIRHGPTIPSRLS